MALRSSIARLKPVVTEVETEVETAVETEIEQETEQQAAPVTRGRVAAPTVDTPKVETRGRPRQSEEEKAAKAAERAAAPKPVRAPRAVVSVGAVRTPAELRAVLKEIEVDHRSLKDAIELAMAKFQPKIDALRAAHSAASAELSAALLK